MRKGPVVIEMQGAPALSPVTAPPVPDGDGAVADGRVPTAAFVPGAGRSRLAALFLGSALSLAAFIGGLWVWDFVASLLQARPLLGRAALLLFAVFLGSALLLALAEVWAIARIRRIDRLRQAAIDAVAAADTAGARQVVAALARLYRGRAESAWGLRRLEEQQSHVLDAETLIQLAERELLSSPDQLARREIERAARQVAAVTALVPLALADVIVALLANLRMIRAIALHYGGRSGFLGSWRLLRSVMTHLVATGAVAVGDDLLQSVAGGGLLSRLSRRFGEGVINGALTARVGIAAIEVCRPLPFAALPKPKVTNLLSRSIAGLFGRGPDNGGRGSDQDGPERREGPSEGTS